jgi:hypothetical protein
MNKKMQVMFCDIPDFVVLVFKKSASILECENNDVNSCFEMFSKQCCCNCNQQ